MIDGETTGGAFSLVEHPLPPRALGAPLHTHGNEDEWSYVLEGRVGIQLGSDVLEAGPGEVVSRYDLDIDFGTIPTLAERHRLRLLQP